MVSLTFELRLSNSRTTSNLNRPSRNESYHFNTLYIRYFIPFDSSIFKTTQFLRIEHAHSSISRHVASNLVRTRRCVLPSLRKGSLVIGTICPVSVHISYGETSDISHHF